jgi:hypothetical protein
MTSDKVSIERERLKRMRGYLEQTRLPRLSGVGKRGG